MASLKRFFLAVSFSIIPFTNQALADVAQKQMSPILGNNFFPLMPRLSGMGLFGDGELLAGDGMAALWGNQDHIVYMDVQAKTAFDTDWMGSLGTGIRAINNDQRIFGAYVFVDRSISPHNNEFWFVSPGIETLGFVDFRANAYFPTSSKRQYGATDWADNFGIYNYVVFQGHTQYDIMMTQDEEVGWGGDAEIGSIIPGTHNIRLYVGGYHFNYDDADAINGIAGRVEIPVNRFLSLTARNSYDNVQHNTFMAGLQINLGGVNTHPRDPHQAIQERMLDPIERNMATLNQGTGEPIQDVLTPIITPIPPVIPPIPPVPPVPPSVERDNIWFFSPTATGTFDGTINACTAENPCIDTNFIQSTIDGINQLKATDSRINNILSTSPSFYLAPSTYLSLNGTDPLSFDNDWLWGRTTDFKAPLQSAELIGAVSFSGSNNLLDHIILENSAVTPQDVAVILNANGALTINATRIGIDPGFLRESISSGSYSTAIHMQDAFLAVINGSEIYAETLNSVPALGINAEDTLIGGSTISINDSLIKVKNTIDQFDNEISFIDGNLIAAGIRTNDIAGEGNTGATINLSNSQIEALADVGPEGSLFDGYSIMGIASALTDFTTQASVIQIILDNSSITTNGNFDLGRIFRPPFPPVNTVAIGVGGNQKTINLFNNSTLTATDDLLGFSQNRNVYGIWLRGDGTATINATNSSINTTLGSIASSLSNSGIAIGELDNVTINLTDSTINTVTTLEDQSGGANSDGIIWLEEGFLLPSQSLTVNLFGTSMINASLTNTFFIEDNIGSSVAGIATPEFTPLQNLAISLSGSSSINVTQHYTSDGTIRFASFLSTGIYGNTENFTLTMSDDSSINANSIFDVNDFDGSIPTTYGVAIDLARTSTQSNIALNDRSQINSTTTINLSGNNGSFAQTAGIIAIALGPHALDSLITLNNSSKINASTTLNEQDIGIINLGIDSAGIILQSRDEITSTINLNDSAQITAETLTGPGFIASISSSTFTSEGIYLNASTDSSQSTINLNGADNLVKATTTIDSGGSAITNNTAAYAAGIQNDSSGNGSLTIASVADSLIKGIATMNGDPAGGNLGTVTAYGIDHFENTFDGSGINGNVVGTANTTSPGIIAIDGNIHP